VGAAAVAVAAVREAAARTGTDFSFLLAQAKVESGLDAGARAATSSARGLFQFTKATWLEMVQKHGAAHGLGWAAEMLESGAAKAGTAARETILSLREHPVAASLMAGELVRDNAAVLEAKLGRATGAVDHYLAHFLGAGGAGKFLTALERTPGQAAAAVVPAAAAANRSVFYGKDGRALSLAEVRDRLAGRLARAGAADAVLPVSGKRLPVVAAREAVAPADAGVAAGAATARARMAYMLLAELGG
jgi:hypothetical protein